ncbi:MAG: N-acetyltransferase [Thermodesulfovibrionales bacterium]|nr:N-acetyltransferase [Thermodesulfovibrionales bacterium]
MIRKAKVSDIKAAHKLINEFSKKQEMIPRSLNELYENVRDLFVFEEDGRIGGVCAVHIMWEDLAEIRSLAVDKGFQGRGAGKSLVARCLKEAKSLGVKKAFALTYRPEFFLKMGFRHIDKASLPQKIWGDCLRCPKFPECDEFAVITDL